MKMIEDMTDREIAALTEDEIENQVALEMMREGVKHVLPPQLETVPEMPAASSVTVWEVSLKHKNGYTETALAAFESPEMAQSFCDLRPATIQSDYNSDMYHLRIGELLIASRSVLSKEDYDKLRSIEKAHKEATERNEKRSEDYLKEREASVVIRSWTHNEWYRCLNIKADMERIAETYENYLGHTKGDARMACTFLLKAHTQEEIIQASEWTGSPAVQSFPWNPQEVEAPGD